MIKIFLVILCSYIFIVQILSRHWFRFCKCKNECRNGTCKKAKNCELNTVYEKDK